MSTSLICVGRDDLDKTWPLVEHLFEAAYRQTDYPMPDVLDWLKKGEGLLWIATGDDLKILSALTTSIEQRASGRALVMVANGGDMVGSWKHHVADIEEYAKSRGCVMVRCIGRPGWQRVLPGFEVKAVSLEKRI